MKVSNPFSNQPTNQLTLLDRCLYGNSIGFLGGISWALMMARVCQLYPNALPGGLVTRFFRTYTNWKWPEPVILTNIQYDGVLSYKVWGSHVRDKLHVMPVITPAYPAMNSSYNISESTKKIILKEFSRGMEITFQIETGKMEWSELFRHFDFFSEYSVFLSVFCFANAPNDHKKW
eukprot:TRINITY_DN6854_c0_g2_i1.p1 TRINITY_DN6854_c0_g2~~TRINITY_DN6854_c0_g2_i1.p1  ORF type:complete len:176 (+),score=33.60 TRINITY_DN6854_c0_g2_i1:320-847(+)